MASTAFLIGGALVNALAFTGNNYLFSSLSKESIDKERKRHNKAIKDLQRAQIEWAKKRQERLDYMNNQIMKQHKGGFPLFAETTHSELASTRWLAEQFPVII